MSAKKRNKATKHLKKSKKLQATKPLTMTTTVLGQGNPDRPIIPGSYYNG